MLSTESLVSVNTITQHEVQPARLTLSNTQHSENKSSQNKHELRLSNAYAGCVWLPSHADNVALYIEAHHEWFERCAHPMNTSLIGPDSYRLCPGQFKCLNVEIEPSIDMRLISLADGSYRLENIPLKPSTKASMYELDFCLALDLDEIPQADLRADRLTCIQWGLTVAIRANLPRVVRTLPNAVVRHAGMQLLNRVVHQVIQQLTDRITTDFTDRYLVTCSA